MIIRGSLKKQFLLRKESVFRIYPRGFFWQSIFMKNKPFSELISFKIGVVVNE